MSGTEVNEIIDQILAHFITEWNDYLPVEFENMSGAFSIPESTSWVRFRVGYNDSNVRSMQQRGKRRFNRYGMITYWVFCPLDTGTYDGSETCIKINNIFEGESLGEIDFTSGSWKSLGTDGKWFQFNGYIH